MSKYELGQQVTFTRTLARRGELAGEFKNVYRKFWTSEGWPGQPEPEARQGIIVGYRHLTNGDNQGGTWDEPTWYRAKERLTAYLIAFDIRRKPVLVLPEHVKAIEQVAA